MVKKKAWVARTLRNSSKLNKFIVVIVMLAFTVLLVSGRQNVIQQDQIGKIKLSNESSDILIPVIISLKEQPLHEVSQKVQAKNEPKIRDIQNKVKTSFRNARTKALAKKSDANAKINSQGGLKIEPEDIVSALSDTDKQIIFESNSKFEKTRQEMIQDIIKNTEEKNQPQQQKIENKIEELGGHVQGEGTFYNVVFARIPANKLKDIENLPEVAYIEKTAIYSALLDTSTYSIYSNTFWNSGYSGYPWAVAVVDTGIDKTHPSLSVGYEGVFHSMGQTDPFYNDSASSKDDLQGHGTHVAGIIKSNDSTYRGVANGTILMNAKFGWKDVYGGGSGYESDAMQAIDWAVNSSKGDGAEIISFSFGGPATSSESTMSRYFDSLVDSLGVVAVIASGNSGTSGSSTINDPGISYNAITVGAIDDQNTANRIGDMLAPYSSRGPVYGTGRIKPDIMAPGSNIMSANYAWEGGNPDFVSFSGTSMATPHISGAAALLMSAGVYDPREIKALLISTAQDENTFAPGWGTLGPDYNYGWGYADLQGAFVQASGVGLGEVNISNRYVLFKAFKPAGGRPTIVWNRHANYINASYPDTYYNLSDLNLYMYNESDGLLLNYSISADENVERIEEIPGDINTNVIFKVDAYDFAAGISSEKFALATYNGFNSTSGPDLKINISNPDFARQSDNFSLSINVANLGDVPAHNVNLTLSLPPGFTIVSGSNFYNLGSIPAWNDTALFLTLKSSLTQGSQLMNASVTSSSYGENYTTTNLSSIYIDPTRPVIIGNPTTYESTYSAAKNGSRITLNATIIDTASGIKNASVNAFSINNSLMSPVILRNDSGYWINDSVFVNASDGVYLLNVTAYDNVSNENTSAQISVRIDNTLPIVTINPVSYQRGNASNNGSIITFNISAEDPVINSTSSGLRNASVNASLINGTGWITLTNQSGFWKGNATFDKFVPDGNYSLNVTFSDNAENVNSSEQVNITIDNTPPSITAVSAFPYLIEVGGVTHISAYADDNFELNISEVYIRVKYPNGTSIDYRMTYSMSTSYYGYTFTDTMQYGRYNVTIIANDTTGNTNSSVTTWFVTAKSNSSLVLIHGGYNGTAANDTTIWDSANFPGLMVEETLNVQNVSNRMIPQGNLWYNTSRQIVNYSLHEANSSLAVEKALDSNGDKVLLGGYYAKIGWQGISYIAFNGKANKISPLILEQSSLLDKKNMLSGETWDMGGGFALKAEAIDAKSSPRQVWFNLSKNGIRLDDKVLRQGEVYTYIRMNNFADETDVPVFVTYVDSIFAGATTDMVQIKYTWLISDNPLVINASDTFGYLTVAQSSTSFVNLTNSLNIPLTQSSIIDLMDKLHIRAANNASLEYYPFFDSPTSVNATVPSDVSLEIFRDKGAAGSIKVTKYADITPGMNRSFPQTPFGKYISINTNNNIINNHTWLKFRIYYTKAELDASGLDESSLKMAWRNKSDYWEILGTGSQQWVHGTGADTSDANGYAGYIWANVSDFGTYDPDALNRSTFDLGTFALIGIPIQMSNNNNNAGSSGSGGGGGGGGGGGTSGENFTNIEIKEKRDNHIFKGNTSSYRFNRTAPIIYVNITGNINAGEVTTMVEVLRNTSALVKNNSAPGIIYKNVNIWVGTSGFAVPKNIKQGIIGFKVTNSWLDSNALDAGDIKMVKWNMSEWIQLDTSEIARDSEYTYYEAKTYSFSPFVITAFKSEVVPAVGVTPTSALPSETSTPTSAAVKKEKAWAFKEILTITAVILAMIAAIIVAVYIKRHP